MAVTFPTHRAVDRLAAAVEGAAVLDAPAKRVAKTVRGAVKPGPAKDALSGTWLGHPVHPMLTDLVTGTWTSALLLDLSGDPAADRLIGAGVVAALPTAVTGVSDWSDAEPLGAGIRRTGSAHAISNVAALGLQIASLAARRRPGGRRRGVALSLAANGVLAFGGWLGGHLSFVQDIGVDRASIDPGPTEWTETVSAGALGAGPISVRAGETPVMLVRDQGTIRGLHDRCSHRGCSLARGEVQDGAIQCACHGSRYALEDGAVLRGPAVQPQPAFDVRERDGRIEVRRRTSPGM